MTALYSGRCRGGPWDGKDFEAERKRYKVAILPPISYFRLDEIEPPDRIELKYGCYVHVLGQWIWHDA